MGIGDKIKNEAQDKGGKLKEGVGAASNDRSMEREGKADQGEAGMKQAGEHVKDAGKDIKDGLK